ncbi:MAG: 30S ribosomal protein S11 [Candidatus Parcubacteria bacterium]|nr:30S ribosomal protein S11 [Candidatus Paceibacterota bacterium]
MAVNIKKNKPTAKLAKNSKLRNKYPIVRICLRANANNSLVTLTDLQGEVIAWSSGGKSGFKGSKKATPFASQKVTEEIIERARSVDANSVHLVIQGHGMGRESFLRAIQASNLQVESIKDRTEFPHGGAKKANRRRI